MQVLQEPGKVVWYPLLIKNSLLFIVIHIVKGIHVVNEGVIDFFFLEFACFLHDPVNVDNLLFGSSAL